MKLSEYAADARKTAIYPQDRCYEYPSLGLAGEIGELCGKLDTPNVGLPGVRKEAGDILWYVANTALDADLHMEELVSGVETFDELEELVAYDVTPLALAALGGQACELAKKYIRDDEGQMTDVRRENVKYMLGSILLTLTSIGKQLGFTLEEAASENLAKLASRQARGVLQGSGDNR